MGRKHVFVIERDYTVHRLHPSWCVRCDELLDSLLWRMVGAGTYQMACAECGAQNELQVPGEIPRGTFRRPQRRKKPSLMDKMQGAGKP